jgi:hypothetical protein
MLNIADEDEDTGEVGGESTGRTTREVECPLTETEVRERGEEMAAAEREAERLKVRRRALNVQIRGRLDRMTELAKTIESKSEMREVSCTWRPDYQRKVFDLVRDDTGKVHEQRVMTANDLQGRLPLPTRQEAEAAEDDEDDELDGDASDIPTEFDAEAEVMTLPVRTRATTPTTPARKKAGKRNSKKGKR